MRVHRLMLLLACFACDKPPETVGSARLPEADDTVEPPAGAVVEVGKGEVPKSLSGPVRIAADSELKYRDVVAAAHAVSAAGGKPVLMVVTRRGKLAALPDPAPISKEAIRLSARVDGKACVSPPDTEEATCISRVDQNRIDRAFVRQILFKAVKEYRLSHIRVIVDPELPWSDVVRAVDGARTCCDATDGVVVSLEPT